MTGYSLFRPLVSLLLIFLMLLAGCSESPPAPATPSAPPTPPDAKYGRGDIVAPSQTYGSSYLVLGYDPASDEYTRAVVERHADGSWYRPGGDEDRMSRAVLERTYPARIARVALSSVPVMTPAAPGMTPGTWSGTPPKITKVSPDSATRDTVVSVTVAGSGFREGAAIKLLKAGSPPVAGTVVSVTGTSVSGFFNLNGRGDGSYHVMVINPDGQSDTFSGSFEVGEAGPLIAGMYPVTGALQDQVRISITGQNFRNDVKISFTKGTQELVCDRPMTTDSTKIACTLDLSLNRGASAGEWTVTVLNIRDGRKTVWVKKFTVTNVTGEN
jgi:hypothetical protein